MFDFVTKHKRILQVFLVLCLVPFAFFGLESYTRAVGGRDVVAEVEGSPISRRELEDALREQMERLQQMFGRDFDPASVDTPDFRQRILDALIADRIVTLEVARSNMVLSREAVIAEIMLAPEFQEDGKFSAERYAGWLRTRNQSDAANVETLRVQAPASRLLSSISATAIQPRQVAERLLQLEGQRREVSEASFAPEAYAAQVKVDEAALKAYYDANPDEFKVAERVRVEYLVLSAEDLARGEAVGEAELKQAYDERLAAGKLGVAEQRRASHILVKTREEAEKILAEAKKAPQRFADLAKKHSQDTGSAEKGGDLGFFAAGDMVKPFAEAVFAMTPNEIAGPVQSEFGFHVIRLSGVQPGKVRGFEDLKAELSADLGKQKAGQKFAESAEGFNNLVYEQSDSLKPAAERYKLKPQASGWISKGGSAEGVLNHPKLLAALFSSDAIQQRRNTDAIEVSRGTLVAARVVDHQPATQRKFEEVRAEVEARVKRREAAALARKDGAAKLVQARSGGDAGLKWSAPVQVSRRASAGLSPDALRQVLSADASKLPAYVGVDRGDRGYVIYRLVRVLEPDPVPQEQKNEELARLDRQAGAAQVDAYVAGLRARAKVEINKAQLEKKQ
ncbi:MAG: SurA N-terminal domain-containing protein [Betaproteobacteria bacterium]